MEPIDSFILNKKKMDEKHNRKTLKDRGQKHRKTVKFSDPLVLESFLKKEKVGGKEPSKETPMKCSPVVTGKTVAGNSCYTTDVLRDLKKAYNHSHKSDPIKTNDPKAIWKELRDRLKCTKEDCWLQTIKDEKTRRQIKEYLFAPQHPKEWNHNPNEWLSNIDIFNVLSQYEDRYPHFEFIGPSFIDFAAPSKDDVCVSTELCKFSLGELMKRKKDKIAVVFNLDKHTGPGTHWVSMFVDVKDKFIFYFDSAGAKIPSEIMKLVKTIQSQGLELSKPIRFKFFQNAPFEHQYSNTECGMYSLFFIITMLTDEVDEPRHYRFKSYKDKIFFFKKVRITDKYVEKLRGEYFNS
jgi:hypothetical protein